MLIRNLPVFRRLWLACLFVSILIFPLYSFAQECIPCGEKYKIARYDFAMKIPAPDLENLQGNEWLTYNTLFSLGQNTTTAILSDACVKSYLPPVYWNYETTNVGIYKVHMISKKENLIFLLTSGRMIQIQALISKKQNRETAQNIQLT